MNAQKETTEDEEWSWTLAPAIPENDGRVWVKLLAYDGEYPVSYIYEHPDMSKPEVLLYEVDAWLADLWCSADGTLYAAAEGGEIHTYVYGRWHVTQTPESSMLASVWGLDNGTVFATGEGVILRLKDNHWIYDSKGHGVYIDSIRGLSDNDIYAVGRAGLILHFDGHSWNRCDAVTNVHLNAVCPVGHDRVYIAGAAGTILIGSCNKWKILSFEDIDFVDVVNYKDNIYLAALGKGLFRLDRDEQLVSVREDIKAVRLVSRGGYLCVAGDLSFHRYNGNIWESRTYTVG